MADVLTQEALDAFVKLLDAVDILLKHPPGAVGLFGLWPEVWNGFCLLEVKRDVRNQVADQGKSFHRRHRDRLARLEEVHPGHAQDRKSTRLNSSHSQISYSLFCLKKK